MSKAAKPSARRISGAYLAKCSSKRRQALKRLAKLLEKKVELLTEEDLNNSGLCWAYSSAKRKLEWKEANERASQLAGTTVFPCPECFHWHVGTLPKLVNEEFFFVDPYTPPVEYKQPKPPPKIQPASRARLQKLEGLKSKYA